MKNRVRELREKQEINQTQFASLCQVSRQTIHAVETGAFNPSVVLALKMAEELGKTVEDLFVLERRDRNES